MSMRLLILLTTIFFPLFVNAQNLPAPSPVLSPPLNVPNASLSSPHENRCGSPVRESMLWADVEGRVARI